MIFGENAKNSMEAPIGSLMRIILVRIALRQILQYIPFLEKKDAKLVFFRKGPSRIVIGQIKLDFAVREQ